MASKLFFLAREANCFLPAQAPYSASTLADKLDLVSATTTSPRISANLEACSASS